MVEVAHCPEVVFGSRSFIVGSEVVVFAQAAAASTFAHCSVVVLAHYSKQFSSSCRGSSVVVVAQAVQAAAAGS